MSDWRDNFRSLGTGAQTGLIGGLLLILILTGGIAYWALSTDYAVLFSDVDSREAATLVSKLDQLQAPYRLEAGGSRIMVPAADVHALRLKLMSEGIELQSGAGFELFNEAEFGMTEFAQKINYQRALQGELARTISSVPGVKYARVHVVLPESSLFADRQVQPKAAVTLILRGDSTLDRRQVLGIQRLVAATVPGLQSGQVTVLDQHGVTLSGTGDALEAGDLPERLEQKRRVEEYLTRKAAEVLDHTFGAGRALARIDVALNFDRVHSRREDVVPLVAENGKATGLVAKRKETSGRESAADGKRGSGGSTSNSSTEVVYEYGREVEEIVRTPGSIQRISVGLIVPPGLTAAQVEQLLATVATVVGVEETRGDRISLYAMDSVAPAADTTSAATPVEPPVDVTDPSAVANTPAPALVERLPTLPPIAAPVAAGLAVALGLSVLVVMRLRRRRGEHLSAQDRQHVLQDVREWLNA